MEDQIPEYLPGIIGFHQLNVTGWPQINPKAIDADEPVIYVKGIENPVKELNVKSITIQQSKLIHFI